MRARIVVLLAAMLVVSAPGAMAQWTPRKVVRHPVARGPITRGAAAQQGPVRFKKAATTGPVVRHPLTHSSSSRKMSNLEWESARGAPSAEYRAYDTMVSDGTRGYTTFPGYGDAD